jgi:uncharacterized protein YbjT (DUF2867 family)
MIAITTPTGSIGQKLLASLVSRGQHVCAIARDPSKLPAKTRERVQVVQGSHGDPAVLDKAFDGAEAVFWLIPPDFGTANVTASYVEFTKPAVEAIKRHGVQRVVVVSALGRGTPWEKKAGLVSAALAMVDLIASTGVNVRELALPSFMDNMLRNILSIRNAGMFALPLAGDLKVPTCSTGDIAEVATKLLLDRSWTGFGSIPVLGPEDLSYDDMAKIIGEVLGKPVRYQQITLEAHKANLIKFGASEPLAQAVIDMMDAKSKGLDNAAPRTPESSSPTSFRQWCVDVLKPAVES